MRRTERMTVYVVSHTHWDREWYLSQRQFQILLADTIDEVLSVLENDEKFGPFVLDGQTSIVDDYLEIRPHSRDRILKLISDGKLKVGPWYTMPDVWLADGESIIRNLLVGRQDCQRLGASPSLVGYVPDSFGHIEQMPQLMTGFGITNYLFSRGGDFDLSADPLEFFWEGPDRKSQITAHYLPGGYQNGMMLPDASRELELISVIEKCIEPYRQRSARSDRALLCNGVDHIWIQRDLGETLDRLRELLPQYDFVHSSYEEYLQEFKEQPRTLPVVRGCLFGKHLRVDLLHGTWSSRIDNKIENARAMMVVENWAEPLAAFSLLNGGKGRREELSLAWRLLLQNHAHDSICGCSCDRVHNDVSRRFTHVQEIAEMVAWESLVQLEKTFFKGESGVLVYPGLNGCNGFIELKIDRSDERPFALRDRFGTEFSTQSLRIRRLERTDVVSENGVATANEFSFYEHTVVAKAPEQRSLTCEFYNICQEGLIDTAFGDIVVTTSSLENECLFLEVDKNGGLTVHHKKTGRSYSRFLTLSDEGDSGGGYIFKPLPHEAGSGLTLQAFHVSIIESGPIRGGLRIEYDYALPSDILNRQKSDDEGRTISRWVVEMRLSSKSDDVEFRCEFMNSAKEHRLRLNFPMPFSEAIINVERAFVVTTESMDGYTSDKGQNNHCMRNWVAVENSIGGVAFVGHGLHEWSYDQNTLLITLLRSVPFVGTCGSWETPDALLLKKISYKFSLLFYEKTWRAGAVALRAARYVYSPISHVLGNVRPRWAGDPHASVKLKHIRSDQEEIVSSHRSSWQQHFVQRDGWRREESLTFNNFKGLRSSLPISWNNPNILLCAFKEVHDSEPSDVVSNQTALRFIVRFYSLAEAKIVQKFRTVESIEALWICSLSEKREEQLLPEDGVFSVSISPFEIITLEVVLEQHRWDVVDSEIF